MIEFSPIVLELSVSDPEVEMLRDGVEVLWVPDCYCELRDRVVDIDIVMVRGETLVSAFDFEGVDKVEDGYVIHIGEENAVHRVSNKSVLKPTAAGNNVAAMAVGDSMVLKGVKTMKVAYELLELHRRRHDSTSNFTVSRHNQSITIKRIC